MTVSFVPETIQLSAECRRDALNVTNDDEKKEFYDKYGRAVSGNYGVVRLNTHLE